MVELPVYVGSVSAEELDNFDEKLVASSKRIASDARNGDILRQHIIDCPYITVVGKPFATLAEKLEKHEKARLAARWEALGADGLANAERELEAAKLNSISWIPVRRVQEPDDTPLVV
ncbi:uncharacterized protein F5891DRAFT_988733 [Suillus fuscotomentosus]|uniref:Uncharacterized protein n=1 Tax=Suillus fuscotomentosus TaxID=1912939 RepID=A0AAD4HB56_9AGAM|nr:uncharacterized protein F5891DRAFT_988733 [Suillus fuscotomentosus]KAG1886870.1 hypothetical protein F5891DRAFT_988733 [Suillus fuscotomentosus]